MGTGAHTYRRGRELYFTLVEILVIIVILGLLAGIVVYAFGSGTNETRVVACKSHVLAVQKADDLYKPTSRLRPALGEPCRYRLLGRLWEGTPDGPESGR